MGDIIGTWGCTPRIFFFFFFFFLFLFCVLFPLLFFLFFFSRIPLFLFDTLRLGPVRHMMNAAEHDHHIRTCRGDRGAGCIALNEKGIYTRVLLNRRLQHVFRYIDTDVSTDAVTQQSERFAATTAKFDYGTEAFCLERSKRDTIQISQIFLGVRVLKIGSVGGGNLVIMLPLKLGRL